MSWHFSQAVEEEYLVGNYSGGERFAPLNSIPTAQDDSCSDKMKGSCHRSPFGMMFVPSTDETGAELLTLFLEDSRAKTSAQSELVTDWTGSEADCGEKWPASLARYDRDSCSWKTAQCSLFEDLEQSLETWPRWGLMLDGECWALDTPDSITRENVSGLLPTPLKSDWKGGSKYPTRKDGRSRLDQWKHYVNAKYGLTYPHPTHSELRLGWPQGWTDFKPLEMDKFRQWQRWHGGF
jgi:hypothetical protein